MYNTYNPQLFVSEISIRKRQESNRKMGKEYERATHKKENLNC